MNDKKGTLSSHDLNNELFSTRAQVRTLREEYDKFQLRVQTERREQDAHDETKARTTQFAHEEQVRHALARAASLEKQVADLRNSHRQPEPRYAEKSHSYTSHHTQEFSIDGGDGGDDDDDDYYEDCHYEHHRPKNLPKVFTGTQTQTRTASASTGAPPRDDGGKPPRRPDSSGGGDSVGGGGAKANLPGRRSGSDGRGNQGNGGPGGGPGGDDGDDADDRVPAPRRRPYEAAANGYIRKEPMR